MQKSKVHLYKKGFMPEYWYWLGCNNHTEFAVRFLTIKL